MLLRVIKSTGQIFFNYSCSCSRSSFFFFLLIIALLQLWFVQRDITDGAAAVLYGGRDECCCVWSPVDRGRAGARRGLFPHHLLFCFIIMSMKRMFYLPFHLSFFYIYSSLLSIYLLISLMYSSLFSISLFISLIYISIHLSSLSLDSSLLI